MICYLPGLWHIDPNRDDLLLGPTSSLGSWSALPEHGPSIPHADVRDLLIMCGHDRCRHNHFALVGRLLDLPDSLGSVHDSPRRFALPAEAARAPGRRSSDPGKGQRDDIAGGDVPRSEPAVEAPDEFFFFFKKKKKKKKKKFFSWPPTLISYPRHPVPGPASYDLGTQPADRSSTRQCSRLDEEPPDGTVGQGLVQQLSPTSSQSRPARSRYAVRRWSAAWTSESAACRRSSASTCRNIPYDEPRSPPKAVQESRPDGAYTRSSRAPRWQMLQSTPAGGPRTSP